MRGKRLYSAVKATLTGTMSDELKEFIHERFRRADEKLDLVLAELFELKTRVGRIELSLGQMHMTLEHSNRMDRIEGRIDTLAKRYSIANA
jgi:hypothetical protein